VQAMKKYKNKIDVLLALEKKRRHHSQALHFKKHSNAVETERQNKIMLKKLIEIGEGKQSTMGFRRVSIESSPEINEYG
jgi:hypothetical protein